MPRASLPTGEAVLLCSKEIPPASAFAPSKVICQLRQGPSLPFVACHAPHVAVASLLAVACLGGNRPGRIDPPFRRPAKGKGASTRLPVASRQ